MNMGDSEDVAPTQGLRFANEDIVSSPDGNTIKLQIIRPDNAETLACVYYIHGGGMASLSSFLGTTGLGENHRVQGRRRGDGRIRNSVFHRRYPKWHRIRGIERLCLGLKWTVRTRRNTESIQRGSSSR